MNFCKRGKCLLCVLLPVFVHLKISLKKNLNLNFPDEDEKKSVTATLVNVNVKGYYEFGNNFMLFVCRAVCIKKKKLIKLIHSTQHTKYLIHIGSVLFTK